MSLAESIRTCFQKYFDFSGRASRPEFWWFFLCAFAAQAILGALLPGIAFLVLLSPFLAVSARRLHDTGRSSWWLMSYLVAGIGSMFSAAAAISMALAGDAPFTDFDATDAGILVPLLLALAIGVACGLLPLALCALPGTSGANRYGPEPSIARPETEEPPPASAEPGAVNAARKEDLQYPKFCAQCGSRLAAAANFCASCGAAV